MTNQPPPDEPIWPARLTTDQLRRNRQGYEDMRAFAELYQLRPRIDITVTGADAGHDPADQLLFDESTPTLGHWEEIARNGPRILYRSTFLRVLDQLVTIQLDERPGDELLLINYHLPRRGPEQDDLGRYPLRTLAREFGLPPVPGTIDRLPRLWLLELAARYLVKHLGAEYDNYSPLIERHRAEAGARFLKNPPPRKSPDPYILL